MYTIRFNARVVDITSGVIKPLVPFFDTDGTDIDEEFNELDVDPETGVVAFACSDYAASLLGLKASLCFVHPNEEQPQLALSGDWYSVRWIDEISSFFYEWSRWCSYCQSEWAGYSI